jgi:hypothetical protein
VPRKKRPHIRLDEVRKLSKPWKRLDKWKETASQYELFRRYCELDAGERSVEKLKKYVAGTEVDFSITHIRQLCVDYKWSYRAAEKDSLATEKSIDKSIDKEAAYLSRAAGATQKLVAILAEKALAAAEAEDDEAYKKIIKKLEPLIGVITGKGKLGEFLLSAHTTFHGQKSTLDANIQTKNLNWGVNVSVSQPESPDSGLKGVSFKHDAERT